MVQWDTVILMLILQCIISFWSQSIDFKNIFSQEYIQIGEHLFIEITRYLNSNGGQYDVFIRLNKILYGQSEDAHLWYENFQNGLLDSGFMVSNLDPCLFMSKTVICVVYLDDCMFWAHSQSEIDNVVKSFEEDGPKYNW